MNHYYVILSNGMKPVGARLCQDMQWRNFASFGTFPECVKVYRTKGWADRAATKCRHSEMIREWKGKDSREVTVLELTKNQVMDASGRIFEES